jgi:acyl-CoA synthetase (AMP-forming)/AMP-acid ligase II
MGYSEVNTMRQAIDLLCRWNAGKELIVDGEGRRYDGERLNREARAFAHGLRNRGIGHGSRVAFVGSASCRFYAAYFAAQKLGCVNCNIHARESADFMVRTLIGIDAAALVCSENMYAGCVEAAEALPVRIPVFSLGEAARAAPDAAYGEMVRAGASEDPPAIVSPHDEAIIILSSGSTGTPKRIVHSNANFVRWLEAAPALFGHVTRSTRFLVNVGTSFAAWPFSSIPILYAGGTIVLMDGFAPEAFCEAVQREKITMAGPVPTMIRMLEPSITGRYDLGSFRMVLCAGEPPSEGDIERVLSWANTDIRCLYLASESAPAAATFWELADRQILGKAVCAGKPVPGADIRVVDPGGGTEDLCSSGERGEILLRGPTLAQGYLGDDELTARRFVGGWWRSGDLGWLDEDGYLHVQGRTDNVINTGGIKVQGEEVESCLIGHASVSQVAVIGVEDPRWGQRIEAHIVTSADVPESELRAYCATRLASFKQPKSYVFHQQLPLGLTGKLDRVALRRRYGRDSASESSK